MHRQRQTATAALILLMAAGSIPLTSESQAQNAGEATADVTVVLPANAKLYFDGHLTAQTGSERTFTTPPLAAGAGFHYDLLARWTENGKVVEKTRKVQVRAGARIRVVFADEPKKKEIASKEKKKEDFSKEMKNEKQVVTSKAAKRVPATTINFKKAYNLPFHSLGTLGCDRGGAAQARSGGPGACGQRTGGGREDVQKEGEPDFRRAAEGVGGAGQAAPPGGRDEGCLYREAADCRRGEQRRLLERQTAWADEIAKQGANRCRATPCRPMRRGRSC